MGAAGQKVAPEVARTAYCFLPRIEMREEEEEEVPGHHRVGFRGQQDMRKQ